jgi:hypothetical protein
MIAQVHREVDSHKRPSNGGTWPPDERRRPYASMFTMRTMDLPDFFTYVKNRLCWLTTTWISSRFHPAAER